MAGTSPAMTAVRFDPPLSSSGMTGGSAAGGSFLQAIVAANDPPLAGRMTGGGKVTDA
jgi:hypothetical protein